MNPIAILVAMFVSVAVSTTLILVILRRKKQMQGRVSGLLQSGNSGTGTCEGTEYQYEYFPGGKNAPSYFRISVPCRSAGSFTVAKETGFDRLFARFGLSNEIRTGDAGFDDSFYITTNTVAFTKAFLSMREKRSAIRAIHDAGFNRIGHDGKVLMATCSPFRLDKEVDAALIEAIVSHLAILAQRIPATPVFSSAGESNWKLRRVIAFAIPCLLYMIGITAFILGMMKFQPLDIWTVVLDSLRIGIPALALFLWIAVMLLKGRSTSHREWIIVFAMALIAFPGAAAGCEILLNGYLDRSEASTHVVKVIGKYESRSDKGTSYHAVVESWRQRNSEKLKISSHDYPRLTPNRSEIAVTTSPGEFGFEWLVGYQLGAAQAATLQSKH